MARRKEDHELLRRRKGTGAHYVSAAGYVVTGRVQGYEHRLIAERVLGKPLPSGAEMHHVDGNRLNNAHSNLVICPSTTYHKLLHSRAEALKATGNPSDRRCVRCKEWDSINNLVHHGQNERFKHKACEAAYRRQLKAKRNG